MLWIWLLILIPIITSLLTWLLPKQNLVHFFHLLGSSLLLISAVMLLLDVVYGKEIYGVFNYIYVDSFNAFMIFILTLVAFFTSLYTIGYLQFDLTYERVTRRYFHRFYLGFHLFLLTMILVMLFNNLALVWISIELTTLISALLIAFYRKPSALEAAWKYFIIGSLGIAFGLFGILFLFASGFDVIEEGANSFNWTVLYEYASELDPTWVSIAFVFVLIGYGTKAGLAPLHFWLPDAHSEAPSPISAILSGVLLNTALYAMLRVYLIANENLLGTASNWLLFFGLFSVVLMVPFIILQQNYKRMLAYSSVEHIGVITLGIGIGGPIGFYGAILHMLNHSIVKSMLFMSTGNIEQSFQTKQTKDVRGLFKLLPLTALAYTIGILAIAGTPPFNIFISEITIMLAGFSEGHPVVTTIFIFAILIIFAGMIVALIQMVFGEASAEKTNNEWNLFTKVPLILPILAIVLLAVYIPPFIKEALTQIVHLFEGGF